MLGLRNSDVIFCLNYAIYIQKNKTVSKGNKSRTLLWYSITYHYDLIFLSTGDANQKNCCIRRYVHLNGVHAMQTGDFIQDPHLRA